LNWAALAAFGSLFGVVVTIVSVAYMSGQFTQQIKDGAAKTADHAATLEKHAEKLEVHGGKIERLTEWKDGFNAAARVSGSKEVQ
jgi:hypothetical protein